MTRRLGGGIGRRSLAAFASLSLAATLAGGFAIVGCGGDSNPDAGDDGGSDAISIPDVAPDRGMDVTIDVFDAGIDRGIDAPVDVGMDVAPDVMLAACPTPTLTPNGGAVAQGSNVTITAAGLPMGGTIFYTTNGTNPTRASLVYNGGIQVNAAETIRAFSTAATCSDSAFASANFTVLVPETGSLPIPAFTPTSTTQTNDFPLALSSTPGATICYTLDGVTTPTCSAAGVCIGNSQTYNAATRISINGTITDATGKVTVQAVACMAGSATTGVGSQSYTLQAAPPTMVAPVPGNLAFATPAPTPTISSLTTGSTIQYTINGMTPTCGVASPGTPAGNPSTITLSGNTTINAVACKMGYAPSTLSTSAYTITLTTPTFPAGPGGGAPGTYNAVTGAFTLGVDLGTTWGCVTSDGSAPACGATASTCGGTGTLAAVTAGPPRTIPVASVTTTGTTIKAVACSLTFNASAAASGTFTLQLGAPDLNVPGVVPVTLAPKTSYSIPVGGFTAAVKVEQSAGAQLYAFACVMNAGTPVCGINSCTTGTQINPAPGFVMGAGTVMPTQPVAGDVWSVIGCPAPGGAFLPSAVTTVTYSAPGAAGAPAITPASAGPYMATLQPTITNSDPNPVKICYTTNGTTPTCAAGACTVGTPFPAGVGTTATGASSATISSYTLTAGGSGYTGVPLVSFSGGGGSGATATATIAGGVVTGIVAGAAGTGYTSPPTVIFTGGGGTGAAAMAFLDNAVILAALQTDNQVVKAVACSTTETVSPTASQTYNFTVAEPDFTFVQTTPVNGDLNGGGALGAGQMIRLSTASNFTSETIHYTTNGTPATCASGTTITTPPGNVQVLTNNFTLSAVGCAGTPPAQQPSVVRNAAFTVSTATPIISPTASPWQNTIAAVTITNVTAGATICYTNDGSIPTCAAGACTAGTPLASGASIAGGITTSGTHVQAVACTATLASSAIASATYVLNISNVVASVNAACPATGTIGLDQTAATMALGGPTINAEICYTTDGTAPAPFAAACAPNGTLGTTLCFSSGVAGAGTHALSFLSTTSALQVITCDVGFNSSAVTPTAPLTVTPYPSPNPIVIDGAVAEWSAGQTFAGNPVAVTGYFTPYMGNLDFAVTGYTPAASTDVVIYIGDGTLTGSTTPPGAFVATAIPFPARWAFGWVSDNSAGNTFAAYAWSGTAWTATTLTGLTRGFQSGATVEFGLPLTSLGSPGTVTVAGAIVTNPGTVGAMQTASWPSGGALHYVKDVLSSCQTPLVQLQ